MLTSAYEIHLNLPYPASPMIRRSTLFFIFVFIFHPARLNRTTPPVGPGTPPSRAWSSCDRMAPSPSAFGSRSNRPRTSSHLSSCLPFSFPAVASDIAHTNPSVPHPSLAPADPLPARRTHAPHPPVRRHPTVSPLSSPPSRSPPRSPQPRVIDHQKLKECLGSVVRSKEGSVSPLSSTRSPPPTPHRKMVNVNAQFPFNLRNQDHPEGSSSRSSRNVSGGTLASSRAASPSPRRPLHKSASTTSFRPDGEDAPPYLLPVAHPPAPILNVRLVKVARSPQSTRGRPQRSGDPSSRAQTPDPQLAADQGHAHTPEHAPVHVSSFVPVSLRPSRALPACCRCRSATVSRQLRNTRRWRCGTLLGRLTRLITFISGPCHTYTLV